MKFFYILLLIISIPSQASSVGILRCLGLEEARLHENKITGPIFNLNQRLISELVQIPGLRINQYDYRRICSTPGYESLRLLEQVLVQGKKLFINTQQGMQESITQGMIDEFIIQSKEIFLNFVSQVQMISPTADCLNKHIPQLPKLLEEMKHLEDEIDIRAIFGKKDLVIFKKLEDYPIYFRDCEKSKSTESSGSKTSK